LLFWFGKECTESGLIVLGRKLDQTITLHHFGPQFTVQLRRAWMQTLAIPILLSIARIIQVSRWYLGPPP
jgi:hypothetical protein